MMSAPARNQTMIPTSSDTMSCGRHPNRLSNRRPVAVKIASTTIQRGAYDASDKADQAIHHRL
jgi:hypothetical protein